ELARDETVDDEPERVRVDVDDLAEPRMRDRAVVALEVVLERDLPVRLLLPPERPVEPVCPGVVRALERLAAARALGDDVATVPADVDEAAQLAVRRARDDDRNVPGHRREVAPGLRDLLRGPRVLPRPLEDPGALEREDRRIRVPRRRQRRAFLERDREWWKPVRRLELHGHA